MAATKMFFRSGRLLGSFHGSLLKYNVPDDFQEVFQTISRKSSESLLTESSPMSFLFITNLSVLVFNRMVLIFHLDISGFDMQVFSDLEDFSDDLHVFHHMVLIFHSLKVDISILDMFFRSGFEYEDDFQEVFQTIFRKSSESLLTESSPMSFLFITNLSVLVINQMVLIFHLDISGFDMQVFSDLEDFSDDLHVSRIKYNALDDFQKSSRRLPGSLLTKFSFISSGVQACLCR
ncbi:hypothetical protein F2Q69_00028457 [Brassica cretica]|uniref:Uncharacterized protein n=1 Tax=Brassica cretica TaxID=69181 RepID=A0A8S9S512_BRACR|nr:hypothetical protein F2Q69_00028457 [Brassica cretica]